MFATDGNDGPLAKLGGKFYGIALYPDRIEWRQGTRSESILLRSVSSVELHRPIAGLGAAKLTVTAGLATVQFKGKPQPLEEFRAAVNQALAGL